ncbi:Cytohesin-1 [Balamuthia mandrillaris]
MEPLVLQRGVLVDKDGHTPLHRAVMADHSNCVEYLLQELKISADDADTSGITALHMAAEKGFLSCAKLLLESGGCKVDPIDKEGRTPLHLACLHGHPEVVRCLLVCRANVAIKDASGCTGVHHAAGRGQKQCLELLLQHGAHADIEEEFTTSPLHYAAFKGRTECIDLLLSKGANPNSRDEEGATPLHKAAFRGYLSSVECLLEKGAADHQFRDQDGAYPLHKAAYSNRTSCLKALLAAGAAVNCEDLDQGTPLHNASYKGHLESVKVLIDSGADVQRRDARGRAPLHLAIRHSHLDCAKALIAAGAQIDVQDADGVSPLHFAATGNIEAVDLLVGAGANVDIRNSQERTPLYYSVKSGNFACIRALVKAGADINATDALGKRVAEAGTVITAEVLAKIAAERDETADKQSKEEMGIAVHKFNAKPLGGINWLVEKGKLKNTPEDIAAFLHNTDGLSKTKIGEFIGSNNELSNAVLVAYVEYIDFTDLEFDQALRKFLIKFRLPGEAQIIDRLMEQYAMRFTACNPAVFQYQDTCYMLAFATIMLNTDAHNPSIKNKMTAEGFVSSIRQLNLQEDISTEWLEDLHRRIVTEEIKMESEGILFGSAEKKGWLVKQGGRIKTWKKRWFILSHNCLYYFKAQEDKDPCGMIPLENLAVRRLPKAARKFCFEIYDPDIAEIEKKKKKGVNGNSGSSSGNSGVDDISLTIKSVKKTKEGTGFTQGHHKEYLLCALSNEECDEWINALERNILGTPMNKLLFSRSRSRGAGGRATSLVNWKETYDFAEKCALAQDDEAFLQRFKLEHTIRTETPHPTAKYHLLTDHLNKKHTLIVYSQKWKDPKKLEKTFQTCARLKEHESFDPYERYQLKEAAENVFKAANTYIKTGYLLFITGHSLGAAVALLVAALFQQSKLVHPTRVVLFGCPRMIRREDLSEWPATLPVLRIDDAKDPVISLFPNFLADGPELILLKEKFFCYMRHPEDRELPVNVLDRDWMQEQIPFHGIEFYLSRLKCKFQGPVHVNEWDKQRFVG